MSIICDCVICQRAADHARFTSEFSRLMGKMSTSPATAVLRALAALAVGLLGIPPLSPRAEPLLGTAGVDGASCGLSSAGHLCSAELKSQALSSTAMDCTAASALLILINMVTCTLHKDCLLQCSGRNVMTLQLRHLPTWPEL